MKVSLWLSLVLWCFVGCGRVAPEDATDRGGGPCAGAKCDDPWACAEAPRCLDQPPAGGGVTWVAPGWYNACGGQFLCSAFMCAYVAPPVCETRDGITAWYGSALEGCLPGGLVLATTTCPAGPPPTEECPFPPTCVHAEEAPGGVAGHYDSCSGELICEASCAGSDDYVCKAGAAGEGWYTHFSGSGCTGTGTKLIQRVACPPMPACFEAPTCDSGTAGRGWYDPCEYNDDRLICRDWLCSGTAELTCKDGPAGEGWYLTSGSGCGGDGLVKAGTCQVPSTCPTRPGCDPSGPAGPGWYDACSGALICPALCDAADAVLCTVHGDNLAAYTANRGPGCNGAGYVGVATACGSL
jgi:hypothetical protein